MFLGCTPNFLALTFWLMRILCALEHMQYFTTASGGPGGHRGLIGSGATTCLPTQGAKANSIWPACPCAESTLKCSVAWWRGGRWVCWVSTQPGQSRLGPPLTTAFGQNWPSNWRSYDKPLQYSRTYFASSCYRLLGPNEQVSIYVFFISSNSCIHGMSALFKVSCCTAVLYPAQPPQRTL